jgi:hypothetical protein
VNLPDDRLGVSFGPGGLFIGPIPLLRKAEGRFAVRPIEDLEYATGLAFDKSIGIATYQQALEGVARALNSGDEAQALLRVQLMGLPALPGADAYERAAEAEALLKASPDDPKHPGYPKGAPDGRGGQFRSKDRADAETTADSAQAASQLHEGQAQLERKVVRRAIRSALSRMFKRRAGLLAAEAASNVIPVVGEIDDIIAVGQMLDMAGQSARIYKEGKVALDFFRQGPHDLQDLFVSHDYEGFGSFAAFKKSEDECEPELEKRFGPPGDGYEYHHIVEQGQGGLRLSANELNSTWNIVRIPKLLHEEISAEYSSEVRDGVGRLRTVVRSKTFDEQWRHGVETMQRLGVIR